MSRNYKFHNPKGLYFVSFATVFWVDVFVRRIYFDCIVKNLNYCIAHKGMQVYAWCIMPSHIHLVFISTIQKPEELLRDFKSFTAKEMITLIETNPQESRKEWLLNSFKKAGAKNSNNTTNQFWQQHNKPIELWSNEVIDQKINYIHSNPVVAGFVTEPHHWKYSSAINFSGGKGVLMLTEL